MKIHLLEECPHCEFTMGEITRVGNQNKLTCSSCKKYIKFLGRKEIATIARRRGATVDTVYNEIIVGDAAVAYDPKGLPDDETDRIEKLHFKIDLLLDHFGIINDNS